MRCSGCGPGCRRPSTATVCPCPRSATASSHDTVEFAIEQARGTGPFTTLATLSFDRELGRDDPGCDQPFDPTVRSGTAISLLPRWLTTFRHAAYRNSRQGRGAE